MPKCMERVDRKDQHGNLRLVKVTEIQADEIQNDASRTRYKIADLNLQLLEVEGNAAACRARRLHQIESASVLAHDGHITLCEEISQVH